MEAIQETTVWEDSTPNHTYLIVNDKAVAYRKTSGEIKVFAKPMRFEKRYRKFKKVVDNELVRSYTVYNS